MSPGEVVQVGEILQLEVKAARSAAFAVVYDLIDREAIRSKDAGDRIVAEAYEALTAKIRALEAGTLAV